VNKPATELVREFWETMQTNDFRAAGELLSDDYVLEWPQSNERIRGRDNFAAINEQYPSHGRWNFVINRVVGNAFEAVSDVLVTDGVQSARAITFSTIRNGKINKQVEFWPEDYPAPEHRKHLVEPIH
jgi:ketosteroid isomerase-like protein